jgi:ArsR family transcriptional regulator
MDNFNNLSQEVNHLHADICSALADPTRILILYLLADKPHTVNELTSKLNTPQPTTSRHLKVLRERGLVRAARQAQNVEYTLNDPRIIEALDLLRGVLRDTLAQRANLITEENLAS